VTVVEQHTNVTHMWTNERWIGEPAVDREKGEVDGLELCADAYNTTTAG